MTKLECALEKAEYLKDLDVHRTAVASKIDAIVDMLSETKWIADQGDAFSVVVANCTTLQKMVKDLKCEACGLEKAGLGL